MRSATARSRWAVASSDPSSFRPSGSWSRRWVSQASLSRISWADLDDLSGMACGPFLVLAYCRRRPLGGAQPVAQALQPAVQQRLDGSFGAVHLPRDVADREVRKKP